MITNLKKFSYGTVVITATFFVTFVSHLLTARNFTLLSILTISGATWCTNILSVFSQGYQLETLDQELKAPTDFLKRKMDKKIYWWIFFILFLLLIYTSQVNGIENELGKRLLLFALYSVAMFLPIILLANVSGILQSTNRADRIMILSLAITVLQSFFLTLLILFQQTKSPYVLILNLISYTTVVYIATKKYGYLDINFSRFLELAKRNAILIIFFLSISLDIWVCQFKFGQQASGVYVAASILGKFPFVFAQIVSLYILPKILEEKDNPLNSKAIYSFYFIIGVSIIFLSLVIFLAPNELFLKLLGDNFINYKVLASLQVLAFIPYCLSYILIQLYFVRVMHLGITKLLLVFLMNFIVLSYLSKDLQSLIFLNFVCGITLFFVLNLLLSREVRTDET